MQQPTTSATDYLLSGKILAFEEWDEADSWFGSVKIAFELYDAKTNDLVWQKTYSERKSATDKQPVEVVKSISESLDGYPKCVVGCCCTFNIAIDNELGCNLPTSCPAIFPIFLFRLSPPQ
ncbi:MAG: hypothetical protein R3C26_15070 [Calditrichia bacterium]